MDNSRTQKVKINSIITLATQFIQIFLGFFIRKLFIDYLSITYLGYNSVFSNILQMLNLADMGIGVAITSFLYKPLADGEKNRISAIMAIYKKLYSIIGLVVLCVGFVVSIFLGTLIPDATCGIWYLRLLFYINLIDTVSTYFLACKRTLLIADQKTYLTNIADTAVSFLISILQILVLVFISDYIIYLTLAITKNIISNIIVSAKVNKEYKYINEKVDQTLINEYKPQILRYVKDVFVSRIGAVVYYSTDNIILSVIKGSLLTGYLSNYTMITGQLNTIVTQVLSSIQATFGNYISTTKDKNARMKMTDNYFCMNFCIGNFSFICFALLAQPFVKMFFGENMLLAFSTVLWLGLNLMLTFLIQLPSQVFIIYNLFRYDRPIIIVSATLNIIISISLIYVMGINGVLVGTFVTSLIYLFSRFFIIAKFVYGVKYIYYIKKTFVYGVISFISFSITYFATKSIVVTGLLWFLLRAVIVGVLATLLTSLCLSFMEEFDFLKTKLLPGKIRKWINKKSLGLCSLLIVFIALMFGRYNQVNFSTAGNKSYERTDSYVAEVNTGRNVFSLSFDDSIDIFKNLNDNKYKSIFDEPILNWYKELHEQYGVVISCYVYYEDDNFNLSLVPSKYKTEFTENSDWLRFGFHTVNGDTNYKIVNIKEDYVKTITELGRIVGTDSIDNVVRLSMFQGSYDGIQGLTQLVNQPVVGLLAADDNRQSYYLPQENNSYIYSHDEYYESNLNVWFFSTDFRTEYIDNINSKINELESDSWNNQKGDLVVFSHEWALSVENKEKIEKVCKYAKAKEYKFVFFEDLL